MIKLSNLELKNFLSHVDTNLSLSDYKGLVLVEGKSHDGHYSSNGSGKSTLLEGIVYALTGDTLRGVAVNDVINRNYKKNTAVSLEFIVDDTEYNVVRYRKDDQYGDGLQLYKGKGDVDISKRVNKETQKLLEDTLNISYKILVSTMLLGEGLSSRFTQLSDPEKKSLIESTLNLNYDISKIREVANTKMKNSKLELANIEGSISILSSLVDTDITPIEDSITDNENCIKIYEETISHLNEEISKISSEIEKYNPKILLLNETLAKISNLESTRESKANEFHKINEELQHTLSSATPTCSLCHQALQSADSKNAVVNQYKSNLDRLYKEIENIDTDISKMPDKSILSSKAEALHIEHNEKSAKYRELMQEQNNYAVKIAEAKRDIQSAKKTIADAQDSNQQLETAMKRQKELKYDISKYEYFYKLFSPTGIIVNILSDAISYINDRLATYSEVLLEKDYRLEFVKGKISIVDKKGSSYQSLSNGEKRRLDIAIQFSLHDYVHMYCGSSVDTMFIDEILDTLDDVGIENIITVLRLKLDYCKLSRIFIISHNNELKSYFDQIITVSKDANGDSRVN